MEEDSESASDDSDDSNVKFINAHYLNVEDGGIDCWMDSNKEIQTRWQGEKAFVMQLEDDMMLRQIFDIVINKRKDERDIQLKYENKNSFFSGIMTIDRAFNNRFNMACELVRETKRDTELSQNDKRLGLDAVRTELERVMRMTSLFKDEEGSFKILYEKTRRLLIEFVESRVTESETMAAATMAAATQVDSEDGATPSKTKLKG